MYGHAFELSDAALSPDFVLPIGKAKVEREGEGCGTWVWLSVEGRGFGNEGYSCAIHCYVKMACLYSMTNFVGGGASKYSCKTIRCL